MSATDIIRSAEFTAERAWGARSIANLNGTTVRLHWTDQPYKWHVNDGEERVARLKSGDIFYAGIGAEHVAHPRGEARILVIEKEGSV